jgi:hypothetical protein
MRCGVTGLPIADFRLRVLQNQAASELWNFSAFTTRLQLAIDDGRWIIFPRPHIKTPK